MKGNGLMARLVLVGAGIAAVRLAQHLRRNGNTDEIVMVSAERRDPYDRPPLSKSVLRGERGLPVLTDAGVSTAMSPSVTSAGIASWGGKSTRRTTNLPDLII
ncbi:FAD-dependent oxidoreductase [Jatrophihabitans sp.]|uniref:FAD-dependent oxidoreductase n=1 Tax=Jatrophihabitans sp. TaxID=1932789 RepID=UPI0030C6F588|nr:FAD-dependent oxidoreductase [Jatrophihabitans sp.]